MPAAHEAIGSERQPWVLVVAAWTGRHLGFAGHRVEVIAASAEKRVLTTRVLEEPMVPAVVVHPQRDENTRHEKAVENSGGSELHESEQKRSVKEAERAWRVDGGVHTAFVGHLEGGRISVC